MFIKNYRELLFLLVTLIMAMAILIYLDTRTLFLATLLIAIISVKNINKKIEEEKNLDKLLINRLIGLWFAISVSPALSIPLEEISNFSNGFLIQAFTSFFLYIYFYTKKPSIIGRLKDMKKASVSFIGADIIAGFAAGISSAILWQAVNISL